MATVAAGDKKAILVVDDDEGIRDMIQDTLGQRGYHVEVAATPREGMSIFRRQRIDLAIVDIFMPERDGLEMLMEMRRHSADARVLAISGGGGIGFEHGLALAQRLGAKGTLAKPFTPDDLHKKVAELLEQGPSAGTTK